MGIFSHNIYENVRTRTIVLYKGCVLLHPPKKVKEPEELEAWKLPGGGLERYETLAECAHREVFEETGIRVKVDRIAFLLEWVVPQNSQALDGEKESYGYGLEVFHYAFPEEPVPEPQPEHPDLLTPRWIPLEDVMHLPIWPKQLKELCRQIKYEQAPQGCVSFVGQIESPWTLPDAGIPF